MNISKNELSRLLKEAQKAHHEYEKENQSDGNWAKWYTDYIYKNIKKLRSKKRWFSSMN
jgi:hypothetical protein